MNNQLKSIAISGLHRGDNPQPGSAVIASIRRCFPNIRIVGLSYDPLESSLYSTGLDHPDVAYLMPYPGVGTDELWKRLSTIIKTENVGYIIPNLDLEISNFIDIAQKLHNEGVQCVLPSKRSLELMSKLNLFNFCHSINVSSPKTKVATDWLATQTIAEEIGYPVYIKGRFYGAQPAFSQEELFVASRKISSAWGWPLIIQEMYTGEEYDIVGIGDGKGNIIKSCSIRKFQRNGMGKGFAGVVVKYPELNDTAEHIINELKWNGPFELEFIKPIGKPLALFEINPRFPCWVDFPSQIGCNLPVHLLENLIGIEQTPIRTCTAGQMFVRHCTDLVGDIAELADMAITGARNITPFKTHIEIKK